MKKTLQIRMDIEVEDLPKAARLDAATCEGVPLKDLPKLSDVRAYDLNEVLIACIENNDDAFSGSIIYAAFKKATIISAKFK